MLQVNFIMICIIHKILLLLKITRILKRFLRTIIDFYFLKRFFFSQHIMRESLILEEENKIIDVRNLFRLKNIDNTPIKDTRNLFRLCILLIYYLVIYYLVILEIFLSMKKKKIIINQ